MRLISVDTYIIQEFFGDRVPRYAILSHTWGEEEVTFQEMQSIRTGNLVPYRSPEVEQFYFNRAIIRKQGFLKIEYTCRQARKDGLPWVWIDTCCIDKTSSSELTEAINSMFQWYQDSSICYAYLPDVVVTKQQDVAPTWPSRRNIPLEMPPTFAESRWFTRGWTLQELLAPARMLFFGRQWTVIRSRKDCAEAIHRITGIPLALLGSRRVHDVDFEGEKSTVLFDYSIAQRMSWMASRRCTRLEDMSYCLLGIFGINMPLLYGEGSRAFIRLQEEIWKETDDHSILAWTVPQQSPMAWHPSGVFADSPKLFARSGHIVRFHEELGDPSVITKKGLQISLHLLPKKIRPKSSLFWRYQPWGMFYAALNCGPRRNSENGARIILLLLKEASGEGSSDLGRERCYTRLMTPTHIRVGDEASLPDPSLFQTVFLRTHRHKLISPLAFSPLNDAILHVHNIPLLYLRDRRYHEELGKLGYEELKKLADQVSNTGLEVDEDFFGYTTDTFSYKTNGYLGYDPRCNTIILARGDYFILKMEIRGQSRGQVPVAVLFGFEKIGKGLLRLELSTEKDVLCPNVRIMDEVNITRCQGDLAEAWIRAGQTWIRVEVHCEHVWESQRRTGVAGLRTHIHLIFTSHFERILKVRQQTVQAWRIENFEQLMEESFRRTGEYAKYKVWRDGRASTVPLLGPYQGRPLKSARKMNRGYPVRP